MPSVTLFVTVRTEVLGQRLKAGKRTQIISAEKDSFTYTHGLRTVRDLTFLPGQKVEKSAETKTCTRKLVSVTEQ